MKSYLKRIVFFVGIGLMAASTMGCYATTHVVGEGGTYDGNDKNEYDLKKKKWYLLWGGVPLDDVSAHKLAGDAQNYTARETFSFGDMILRGLTFGIAGPRTIRISKSEAEKD